MKFFEPQRETASTQVPTLVEQVVQAIQNAVQMGVLKAGMRVPSIRRFARVHRISTFTVSTAYSRLVAQGWLVSRPGAGYWVSSRYSQRHPPSQPSAEAIRNIQAWQPPQVGERWLLEDVFADHSIPIKSGCGWLPSSWLASAGLDVALRSLARVPVGQLGSYGHPYGYFPLRDYLCQELSEHGLTLHPNQVLLTQGATQALDLVFRALLKPGDTVLVEVPCYANVLPMLRMSGLKVKGVSRGANGFDMDYFEYLLNTYSIQAFFVNPVLHNPTGSSLSMAQAFNLLKLTQRYGVLVIEDDVGRTLASEHRPLLAAMAGTEQVVYISSFSKSIAPSTRVGYIVASQAVIELLATRKMGLGLTTPELMERLVYQVVSLGRFKQHVDAIQAKLMHAHHQVYERLNELDYEIFARPYAGFFVWARARHWQATEVALHPADKTQQPTHTTTLAKKALKAGIWLAPGTYFYPNGEDYGWLRFNVAYSLEDELWQFLAHWQ